MQNLRIQSQSFLSSFKTRRWVQDHIPLVQCRLPYLFVSHFWCNCISSLLFRSGARYKMVGVEEPFLQHRQTGQVEGASSHFHRPSSGRPFLSQLWFFVWFSDKLTIENVCQRVGWSTAGAQKVCFASSYLVQLLVWAGVEATAQVDGNKSLFALKCPQCPKNRWNPSNDHCGHLPRCSSSLRNTWMPCREATTSVIETFPG